jgi:hypothetical protein
VEIKEKFVKGYEDKSFAELAAAPVDALKGISKKDAQLLYKAFHIRTVEDLAKLKYAKWAREICELADTSPDSDTSSFDYKLVKKYEGASPAKLAKAPVWALQGVSQKDAAWLKKAFAIKTIRDFAKLKYVTWAQEIVDLARPQTPADKPVDEIKKPMRAVSLLILVIIILACAVIFWPNIRSFISGGSVSTKQEIPPFGERIAPAQSAKSEPKSPEATQPAAPQSKEVEKKAEKSEALKQAVRPCENCYTVKWRDTFISISERLSGDWRNWQKLYDANKDVVKDTRLLIPGTQLKLPDGFRKE